MTKRIRLTPQARDDIIEGALYIAGDNPAAAERFLAAVERTFKTLADAPHIGATRAFVNPQLQGCSPFLVFVTTWSFTDRLARRSKSSACYTPPATSNGFSNNFNGTSRRPPAYMQGKETWGSAQ